MDAIDQLGWGFPSFRSQSEGTQQNRGPWIALTPRVRALSNLPPKAKARLSGLRGLGQDDYTILAADEFSSDYLDYGPGNPSGVYGPVYAPFETALPSPAGASNWQYSAPVAAQSGGSGWSWDSLVKGATAVSQAVAQQRIINMNIDRAKAGLPLLDPRNFSPSAAVNFGLTPQTQSMLLYGALALGAILLLKGRGKK